MAPRRSGAVYVLGGTKAGGDESRAGPESRRTPPSYDGKRPEATYQARQHDLERRRDGADFSATSDAPWWWGAW